MYRNTFLMIVLGSSIMLSYNLLGQSSTATNTYTSTRFLGWDASNLTNPLFTKTNNFSRTKINGNLSYAVNGFTDVRNGYMLLSPLQNGGLSTSTGLIMDNNRGAFSMFHINGTGIVQEFGARRWWKTGITLTDNSDAAYFGLRQVGTGIDVTETVINWTDNQSGGDFGPDDMVFRFTTGFGDLSYNNTNYRTPADLDGLHIARFTAGGFLGLGNTFGVNPPSVSTSYARPQSLFHMSYDYQNSAVDNEPFGFLQITLRRPLAAINDSIGQGEAVTDGLRFGIDNDLFGSVGRRHLNSYLRWQEASSFVIQTEDGGINNIQNNERLRITSIGALDRNYTTNEYIGLRSATTPTDVTRISIAHSGSNGLTRPMSLVHLGYNIGNALGPIQLKNGWRSWMDLGMLVSNTTDNVWIGLKPRLGNATQTNDQLDAVINWGNNGNALSGTDVMRFIFTAEPLSTLDSASNAITNDGLEVMRLYPDRDTTSTLEGLTYGRVGIGDFTAQGVNEQPTHKLDVVGNGRFRALPDSLYMADLAEDKIVMVDSAGVLRWASFVPSQFGTYCADSVGGKLLFDTKVDMDNHNLYFTKNDSIGANLMGLGYDCGVPLEAKFNVFSKNELWSGSFYVDGNSPNNITSNNFQGGVKSIIDSTLTLNATAVYGYVAPNMTLTMDSQVGVKGEVNGRSVKEAIGVFGVSTSMFPNNGAIGGRFLASGSGTGRAVQAQNSTSQSTQNSFSGFGFGGDFSCQNPLGTLVNSNTGLVGSANGTSALNTGVRGISSGNSNMNIGVSGYAFGGTISRAGYFVGAVEVTSLITTPSDQQFKTNVAPLVSALKLTTLLKPKTYYLDTLNYDHFNFGSEKQYGFIAQDVQAILPELIHNSINPAVYDSLGNEISPETSYKSLNYNAIIPINTQAIIELNAKVDKATLSDQSIKTNVQNLNGSLDKVLAMRGVSYDWNQSVDPQLNLDSLSHVGFIAQEIAQIDSRLTYLDADTLLHVEYDKVVPILAEAIEELNGKVVSQDSIIEALTNENLAQQAQIENLNDRLTQLENCLSGILPFLCQMNNSSIQPTQQEVQEQLRTAINVNLSNKNTIVLNQNVPNPFAESTMISYSIPTSVQKAQIHFYDGQGKLINSVDVIERGNGQLNVFANDLSTGVYTYSLVADGHIVSTKRMMKQ